MILYFHVRRDSDFYSSWFKKNLTDVVDSVFGSHYQPLLMVCEDSSFNIETTLIIQPQIVTRLFSLEAQLEKFSNTTTRAAAISFIGLM